MNLRTLLSWGMAAMLFAGCSGGTGSSTPSTNNAVPQTPASLATLSFKIDVNNINTQLSSRRSAQYIGAGVDQIGYSIVPDLLGNGNDATAPSYNGTMALSACQNLGGGSYKCTVNVEANTDYNVGLTTYATIAMVETIVGYSSPSTTLPTVVSPVAPTPYLVTFGTDTPGAQVAISLQMVPKLNLPLLSEGATTKFYLDGTTTQTVTLSTNETDLSGNKITTNSGPVIDYPTLTLDYDTAPPAKTAAMNTATALSADNVTANVTSENTPPAGATGYSGNITLTDNPATVGATSIFLFLSDGITTSTEIEIPFISFSSLATTLTAQGLGAANNLTAITQENTTQAAGGGLDTQFSATTDCPAADATITGPGSLTITAAPTLVSTSAHTATSVNATFTITPLAIGSGLMTPGTCHLYVAAAGDANLIDTFTILLPAALQSTIDSHARR
jgi:hypothetical protein